MTQIWRFRRLRHTPNIFLKYKTRQSCVWRTDEVVVPNLHLPGLARITYGSGIYWIHDYLRKSSHKIIPAVAYLLKFIKSCVTKRPVFDTAHGRKKTREAHHIGINGHLLVLHFGNIPSNFCLVSPIFCSKWGNYHAQFITQAPTHEQQTFIFIFCLTNMQRLQVSTICLDSAKKVFTSYEWRFFETSNCQPTNGPISNNSCVNTRKISCFSVKIFYYFCVARLS